MNNPLYDELLNLRYIPISAIDEELPPESVVLYFKNLSQIDKEYRVLIEKYGVMNIPDTEYDLLLKKLNLTQEELNFYRDVESDISDNWGDWNIKAKIKQYGYDSLINYDGSEYVVYDSRNIKIIDVQTL
jgi:hypothetical protein